ncbi:MarR family transcriptional regulator [Lysobacter sp. GX 14042]|uniref:MarR family winged helix-turn-helix transcriptional regulator n=1 Tax=Lysobacter sp. GX 14042 TaxID=2907155 RepID=UPI001F20393C|nr:MarR family transcriptional regulator [Lysobacter sp. GX 14042]MCE7032708.1 MarR family transcriptional regulator [Lysobacter sp. GX 14042]
MSTATASATTLGLVFRQLRDAMWARMESELQAAGHELTFSQYITLRHLATGATGITELARAAELNPGAMTRLIDRLEARRLVERSADPSDRRAVQVTMTAAGAALWKDVDHCGERVRTLALEGLDAGDRARLLALLDRVRDNLTLQGS